MTMSVRLTVVLTAFLILGVTLAGLFMQPRASIEAWGIKESDFPANSSPEERLTFLLGYSILAPSSYNSQPWSFNISDGEVRLFADRSRWLQFADADQRELHLSLGCALENLVVAAEHFGYNVSITYFPGQKDLVAAVLLNPGDGPSLDSRLFEAIPARHTNRNPYKERAISDEELQRLIDLGSDEGVQVLFTSDLATREKFQNLVIEADRIQYSDADYKSELGHWLGQGGMGPTGWQALLAQMYTVLLDAGPGRIQRDALLLNSTPVLGFIMTKEEGGESQVRSGRTLERLWLEATAAGISLHPMSQALEVPETRAELEDVLRGHPRASGDFGHVQQAFRLGYAEPKGDPVHTPRRPVPETLD